MGGTSRAYCASRMSAQRRCHLRQCAVPSKRGDQPTKYSGSECRCSAGCFELASGTTYSSSHNPTWGSPEGPATPVISMAHDGAIIPRHHRDGLLNSSAPLVRSRPAAMALRETGGEVGGAPPMLGSQ